jgi:protein-disulfide isomerase
MNQSKKTPVIMIAIGLLLIFAAGIGIFAMNTGSSDAASQVSQEMALEKAENAGDTEDVIEEIEKQAEASQPDNAKFKAEDVLGIRILGDENAPVKIEEFASLTCGHCANFHQTVFKELKEKYIDTGKAYVVFSDFPLNGPAVHASLAARCADKDQYFDMISKLFETQDKWAFDLLNYKKYLQTVSADYGLSEQEFTQCINDEALQKGLLAMRQMANKMYQISATPSFVVNSEEKVSASKLMEAVEAALNPPEEQEITPDSE